MSGLANQGVQATDRGFQFRVWAPFAENVMLRVFNHHAHKDYCMQKEQPDFYTYSLSTNNKSLDYQYVINGQPLPDPCSAFQPAGVHGISRAYNLAGRVWQDGDWQGIAKSDLILYEIHVGTYTPEGTYAGVCRKLDELVELGITAIELMPLAQCPGRWNWGYDGVFLFAPNHNYGTPEELCGLIESCHQRGLAVFLDVVYNHLGPEGNYLGAYGPYFRRENTPWGVAPNFDLPAVRAMVLENVRYWLDVYHFDGLRLDAIQTIYDCSKNSIVNAIGQTVQALAEKRGCELHVIGETNTFISQFVPSGGGHLSALWLDDLGHAAESAATASTVHGERKYSGYKDLLQCLSQGYLYASEPLASPYRPRSPEKLCPQQCVNMLQNHDMVGNGPEGLRVHALSSLEMQKVLAAIVILYPSIPLIFMGEEYACESPFYFFTDFSDEKLNQAVVAGRKKEFCFPSKRKAPEPTDPQAFYQSKLKPPNATGSTMRSWYMDLLKIRKAWAEKGYFNTFPKVTPIGDRSVEIAYGNGSEKVCLLCSLNRNQPQVKIKRCHNSYQ